MRHAIFAIALATTLWVAPAVASREATKTNTADAVDPNQAVKCRKVVVTGSLVKKGRVCKTVAEWQAIYDNHNDLARKMVEDGTTRAGGQ
jgi:hypothetical protein